MEKITRTRLVAPEVRGEPAPKKARGRPARGGGAKPAQGKAHASKPQQAHGADADAKSGPQRRRPRRPRITRAA